jgi:rhodanese-related sulfurtransferase
MQTLLLRALLLAFVAAALAVAHSWNTGVLLHLKPQEVDWKEVEAQLAAQKGGQAAQQSPGSAEQPAEQPVEQPRGADEPLAVAPPANPAAGQTEPRPTPASGDGGNYVTVERARQLFDAQFLGHRQIVFIDARARDIFQQGHIEGAMSLPAGELGAILPAKVRNYLSGAVVVIYCQGADCHDSHDVAKRLQAANIDISPIFIFNDGYPAWTAAGHPTMAGPEVGFD